MFSYVFFCVSHASVFFFTCCLVFFFNCFCMFPLLSFSVAQLIDSGAKSARRVVNRFLIMCVTIADMLCCSFHLLQSNDSTHELLLAKHPHTASSSPRGRGGAKSKVFAFPVKVTPLCCCDCTLENRSLIFTQRHIASMQASP